MGLAEGRFEGLAPGYEDAVHRGVLADLLRACIRWLS
jgi:hypothetical protein